MSHYTPILRQAQDHRGRALESQPSVRGELVEPPAQAQVLRQAQDERGGGRVKSPSSVRGELVEPPAQAQVLRQAQDERGAGEDYWVEVEDDPRFLSHPAGRGWQPVSRQRLPGEPPQPSSIDTFAALINEPDSPHAVFTRALQVRFLDRLATCGNVRAACALAGVSPHTAYKARRRDGAFARLWDAALVLARPHAEAVLAARALDGVEVPIVCRGEVVGYRRHYDGRLLLAHLGRLDRAVEEAAPGAHEVAERFDEFLALHVGVEPDEQLIEARVNDEGRDGLPGTLEEVVALARSAAISELPCEGEEVEPHEEDCECEDCEYAAEHEDWEEAPLSEEEEAAWAQRQAVLDKAEDGARALWAAWQEAALAAVDAVLADPPQDGEGDHAEHGGGAGADGPDLASPTPNPSRKREGDTVGEELLPSRLREGPGVGPSGPNAPTEPCHPVTPRAVPRL